MALLHAVRAVAHRLPPGFFFCFTVPKGGGAWERAGCVRPRGLSLPSADPVQGGVRAVLTRARRQLSRAWCLGGHSLHGLGCRVGAGCGRGGGPTCAPRFAHAVACIISVVARSQVEIWVTARELGFAQIGSTTHRGGVLALLAGVAGGPALAARSGTR